MFWRCHGIPCVFPLIFLFVLFKPILRMDTWMRATSATVMVFFSKVLFWKLLVSNCIQSSFSIIARNIGKSIFKETLLLKIFEMWIKICANSFIKTWVNTMKWKKNEDALKIMTFKKYDPVFQRTLHENGWYFTYCYTLLFHSNKPSF